MRRRAADVLLAVALLALGALLIAKAVVALRGAAEQEPPPYYQCIGPIETRHPLCPTS